MNIFALARDPVVQVQKLAADSLDKLRELTKKLEEEVSG